MRISIDIHHAPWRIVIIHKFAVKMMSKRRWHSHFCISRFLHLSHQRNIFGWLLVNGLHRGDWARQFYVSLYIPPKPVAAAFFRLRGVMYLYITYYISIRIWCQYWCQWCQTLSRHQIFQKCSARSVPSIPSVPPHRFPLSFWCPCGPWLPESL